MSAIQQHDIQLSQEIKKEEEIIINSIKIDSYGVDKMPCKRNKKIVKNACKDKSR